MENNNSIDLDKREKKVTTTLLTIMLSVFGYLIVKTLLTT